MIGEDRPGRRRAGLGTDQLRALVRTLDRDPPGVARTAELRAALLRAAASDVRERPARWPLVAGGFVAGALAAAAAVLLVLHGGRAAPAASPPATGAVADAHSDRGVRPPDAAHRAQIEHSTAADFERRVTDGAHGVDDVIRLHGGRIRLAVGPLASGDRVRVVAGDGEVEGTRSYEIAVTDERLREVTVTSGTATIRIVAHTPVVLAAGQTWTASIDTADHALPAPASAASTAGVPSSPASAGGATPAAAGPPALHTAPALPAARSAPRTAPALPTPAATPSAATAPPTPASIPGAATAPPTPAAAASVAMALPTPDRESADHALEQHFAAGWRLLKAGKPGEAARELAWAADAGGDAELAGDARYFQAVALTRAGRKTEAERALVDFLDHAPHAARRGRAAVLLARLIAERGDRAAARAWFASAAHDRDPDVAAAARTGLDRLE